MPDEKTEWPTEFTPSSVVTGLTVLLGDNGTAEVRIPANIFALLSSLAAVALSGDFADLSNVDEVTIANNTIIATNPAGAPIGLANIQQIPLGLDSGAPSSGQVFRGPPMPYPYKILGVRARVTGSSTPAINYTVKIDATAVTGLTSIAAGASTLARQDATAANTGAIGTEPSVTINAAPTGTVTRAMLYLEIEQGAV